MNYSKRLMPHKPAAVGFRNLIIGECLIFLMFMAFCMVFSNFVYPFEIEVAMTAFLLSGYFMIIALNLVGVFHTFKQEKNEETAKRLVSDWERFWENHY